MSPTDDSPSKRCSKCKLEKPISAFVVARRQPDGHYPYCKDCAHAYYVANRKRRIQAARRRAEEKRQEIREYQRRYYQKHLDRLKRQSAARYAEHREEGKAKRRDYAAAHKQEAYERNKEWRQRHSRYSREYKRKRLESDPEKRKRQNECNRQWAHANRAITRKASLRREARLRLAHAGAFKEAEWNDLKDHFRHRCVDCLRNENEVEGGLQADHVIPLCTLDHVPFGPLTRELAELNLITNIQPLCRTCNLKKGSKRTDYRPGFWLRLQETTALASSVSAGA